MGTHDDEAGSSRSKRSRQHETMEAVLFPQVHHEFLQWEGCNRDAKSRMITYGLCQRTTGYDKVQKCDLWLLSMFDARHQNRKYRVLTEDVVRSLSALIYCRDLDTTTIKDLIDFDGKLILGDPQSGVPRVGIPRPLRASRKPTTHLVMLSRSMTNIISSTHLRYHSINSSGMMMSSVETTRVGYVVFSSSTFTGVTKRANVRVILLEKAKEDWPLKALYISVIMDLMELVVIFDRIYDIFEKLSDDFQVFVEIIDCKAALFKGAHGGFHQVISLISVSNVFIVVIINEGFEYVEQWMKWVCLLEEDKTNVGFH
nr:hypothetical protein [Tanacetum cinerariifolium]